MSQVIGLVGHAGSGKSVIAEELETEGFVRLRFSAVLKDMMRGFYRSLGLSETQIERRIEGDLKETPDEYLCGRTPRYAMQMLGTEWGRVLIHKDIWTTSYATKARKLVAEGADIITEDVRFVDEDETMKRLGATMYLVTGRVKEGVVLDHSSEDFTGIEVDATITNSGTLNELRAAARALIEPKDDAQLDLFAEAAA